MSKQLSKSQKRIIEAMRAGQRLWRFGFGERAFEMQGFPESRCFRPQSRTVDILLDEGLLRWKPYRNATQIECGIRELELI